MSSGFRESGATPHALFPKAWKAYDGIVATFALLLMVINALIGIDLFNPTVDRWISVGITAVTAVLIWMRLRATQLGVVKVDNGHLVEPTDTADPKPPEGEAP
jgi:hypothetical protein